MLSDAMTPKEGEKSRRIDALFLCRHNAVRSQMAEALLRARSPNEFEAESGKRGNFIGQSSPAGAAGA